MKIILYVICCTAFAFGQPTKKVALNIKNILDAGNVFNTQDIFTENINATDIDYTKAVNNATVVTINKAIINNIIAQKAEFIAIDFPFNNEKKTVLLYKVDILAEGFNVQTSDNQQNLYYEKGVHYRGIIKNDFNSLVSFNFFKNQMSALVSDNQNGNVVIGKLGIKNNIDNYIIYADDDLKIQNNFTCDTADAVQDKKSTNQQSNPQSNRCVTMYFEMGYSLYTANGSSVSQANIWMNSVFNNVQTLFANDGISIALKTVFVWTTADPYNGTTSAQNLDLFANTRPFFNGDLGQLLVIKGGQGGIAQTINGLCNDSNYSFSDVFFNFSTVPIYSWPVQVISHEFGHSMGSPHTHACVWNGNNTAIDGCGPTANTSYAEGACLTAVIPTTTTKGTIMSYCHLINNVGISFANGFGPQPAAKILTTVNSQNCLSTNCINTCISLISNITVNNVSLNSANISFVDNDLSNTQWEISTNTYPFSPSTWITTATTTHAINNLVPNTYYSFSVRPKCNTTVISRVKKTIFATNDAFCNGVIFTDSGGISNEYGDLENWTRTIIPLNSAEKVSVTFNNFGLETNYDYLYVYNGDSTAAPAMTNGLTGNVTPPEFISTALNGALTFKFVSDPYVTENGWNANINCAQLGNQLFEYLDFTHNFNSKTSFLNLISSAEIQTIYIYSIDGKMIYSADKSQKNPAIDLSAIAKGTYIAKIKIQDRDFTFKFLK